MARTREQVRLPAFEDPDQAVTPRGEEKVGEGSVEAPTTAEAASEEGRVPNLVQEQDEPAFPQPEDSAPPDWARVPADLKLPEGVVVAYFRFKASWTAAHHKGDRTCVVWSLTDKDERLALTRCANSPMSAQSELSKQMIRAFDGQRVDWGAVPGRPGCLDDFWREIGPGCRNLLKRFHAETHSLKPDELACFFESCVALRVGG